MCFPCNFCAMFCEKAFASILPVARSVRVHWTTEPQDWLRRQDHLGKRALYAKFVVRASKKAHLIRFFPFLGHVPFCMMRFANWESAAVNPQKIDFSGSIRAILVLLVNLCAEDGIALKTQNRRHRWALSDAYWQAVWAKKRKKKKRGERVGEDALARSFLFYSYYIIFYSILFYS